MKSRNKILNILIIAVLVVYMQGGIVVYANDIEVEENFIEIFEKDLITGEETMENILISDDESVLNGESYQIEGIMPDIIIGEDEMAPIPDFLLSVMPYSAIGRVYVEYFDGSAGYGTGFLFGPNDVATAAHVLFNKKGSIAEKVTFWLPGRGGPVANYTGTQLAIPQEYMDGTDPIAYDWGMFHINSNIGNTVGYLGWTDRVSINDTVQVIGYPGSEMRMAGRQIKVVGKYVIMYDVDTLPGQSGAPVLNRALDDRMVAIHNGGVDTLEMNQGCRITSRMASVLNKYRNE